MKGNRRKIILLVVIGCAFLVLISALIAVAASNTVAGSRADWDIKVVSANELKPSQCSGINLTNIVDIGAGETGTSANDLILGTDKADAEIRGGAGHDCILGGKGNERQKVGKDWGPGIFGEEGNDIIIGGPGNNDHCDGGSGTNTYYSCETEY
ncbi:MAG: hypothetical protein WBB69_17395 [Anaerolineales bacterium]